MSPPGPLLPWVLETDETVRAEMLGCATHDRWDLYRTPGAAKSVCRACGFEAGWSDRLTMREHEGRCPGQEQLAMF